MRQLKINPSKTDRSERSIMSYFNELSKIDVLSPEEEFDLCVRIKQGDQVALEKLIKGNLRFVISVAKQYSIAGTSLQDLINEGNLGLVLAAKRFDHTKGFKFISYAVWWIRQSIMNYLNSEFKTIRIPSNKIGLITKIEKVHQEYMQSHNRLATIEELSSKLNLKPAMISAAVDAYLTVTSLDAPLSTDDGSSTLIEVLPSTYSKEDYADAKKHRENSVNIMLNALPPIERKVLIMYFGIGDTVQSSSNFIAEDLGVTTTTVDNYRLKALRRLRVRYSEEQLKSLL